MTKAENRRRRITAAARSQFVEHGFHAASMAQISATASVAVGQIYHDFRSKEAIVEAIVEEDIRSLLDLCTANSTSEAALVRDPEMWVTNLFARLLADQDPRLFLEIQAEASRNPRISQIISRGHVRVFGLLSETLSVVFPGKGPEAGFWTNLILITYSGLKSHMAKRPAAEAQLVLDWLAAMLIEAIGKSGLRHDVCTERDCFEQIESGTSANDA